MSVDCRITLPGNVQARDVADVIGALLGCPVKRMDFNQGGDGWAAHTSGVKVEPSLSEGFCEITIEGATVGDSRRRFLYHYEFGGTNRGLLSRSTAVNIAMAKGLVEFFGGSVDFNDSDDTDVDYNVPAKLDTENQPSDGEEWYDLQNRKLAIQPLTKQQIKECLQHASYK